MIKAMLVSGDAMQDKEKWKKWLPFGVIFIKGSAEDICERHWVCGCECKPRCTRKYVTMQVPDSVCVYLYNYLHEDPCEDILNSLTWSSEPFNSLCED